MKSKNHNKEHFVRTVIRDNEILFLDKLDREIAVCYVETMEGELEQPTENFWLTFRAKSPQTCRESADVYLT